MFISFVANTNTYADEDPGRERGGETIRVLLESRLAASFVEDGGRRTEVGEGWSRQEAGAGAACERMCARVRELAGHVSPGDRDVWLSQPASQGAPGCQLTTARLQLGPNMKGKARNQTSNNASRPLFNVQCSVFNVQRLLHRIDPDCQEELWLVKFAPITGNCLRCSQYLTD